MSRRRSSARRVAIARGVLGLLLLLASYGLAELVDAVRGRS